MRLFKKSVFIYGIYSMFKWFFNDMVIISVHICYL